MSRKYIYRFYYLDLQIYKLWHTKWSKHALIDHPSTAVESLNHCNEKLFPNIYFLLKILATLPVSTATPRGHLRH